LLNLLFNDDNLRKQSSNLLHCSSAICTKDDADFSHIGLN